MTQEDFRSLEENYDGEFSSFFGRSQGGTGDFFGEIVTRRARRRGAIKVGLMLSAAAAGTAASALGKAEAGGPSPGSAAPSGRTQVQGASTLTFQSLGLDTAKTDQIEVAPGYIWDRVISWGDPIVPNAPAFSLFEQSPAAQARQAGYNCDFLWFNPLPAGSNSSTEGLLWINNEYTDEILMFPDYQIIDPSGSSPPPRELSQGILGPTREQVDVGLMAHGATIVHIRKNAAGGWEYVQRSPFNRRITGMTPMRITGPAAGDPSMQTSADPSGTTVLGMLNNCGGGWTPWGTVLSAEENFNQYFAFRSELGGTHPQQANHTRFGIPLNRSERGWELYHSRFDVSQEPNEPNRFGWVVEVDPYDPSSVPLKRTALGRMKHEAAAGTLAPNGRWVSYTGDDERFEYLYKFVSDKSYIPGNKTHNMTILENGTLYAARFDENGTGEWLPLVFGQGPLTPVNGFFSQADVLIRARMAADALGATKMDRPEDVEVNPVNKKVYMACTNNSQRGTDNRPGTNAANPRETNYNGHIVEITETSNNHAATTFNWEIFILCGDPSDPTTYFAGFPKDQVAGLSSPDNIAFDNAGNLWIATDGQISSNAFRGPDTTAQPASDSIYAVPVSGPERGHTKRLVNAVPGAEIAALAFTPDGRTLFLAIQHPGEGGTVLAPISHWPDGGNAVARPTVIAVRRQDGGVVGT